jgi:hypothetical protein
MGSSSFDPSVTEAESKEKHGVWDPMPKLTITSPYVDSRVDSNTFTMGSPMPESTFTLCQSRPFTPVKDFGFGLWGGLTLIWDRSGQVVAILKTHHVQGWVTSARDSSSKEQQVQRTFVPGHIGWGRIDIAPINSLTKF